MKAKGTGAPAKGVKSLSNQLATSLGTLYLPSSLILRKQTPHCHGTRQEIKFSHPISTIHK